MIANNIEQKCFKACNEGERCNCLSSPALGIQLKLDIEFEEIKKPIKGLNKILQAPVTKLFKKGEKMSASLIDLKKVKHEISEDGHRKIITIQNSELSSHHIVQAKEYAHRYIVRHNGKDKKAYENSLIFRDNDVEKELIGKRYDFSNVDKYSKLHIMY